MAAKGKVEKYAKEQMKKLKSDIDERNVLLRTLDKENQTLKTECDLLKKKQRELVGET